MRWWSYKLSPIYSFFFLIVVLSSLSLRASEFTHVLQEVRITHSCLCACLLMWYYASYTALPYPHEQTMSTLNRLDKRAREEPCIRGEEPDIENFHELTCQVSSIRILGLGVAHLAEHAAVAQSFLHYD